MSFPHTRDPIRHAQVVAAVALLILTHADPAHATWRPDGEPLGPPRTFQVYPRLASDGAGGSIMVWEDARSCASGGTDIYAQRFDAAGHALWGTDGTPVATAVGTQAYPQVVSDMAGGAILFWEDNRGADTDIYAQRLSSTGAALWAPDGIPICTAPDDQSFGQPYTHAAVSDGMGGALVAWTDLRTRATTGVDIYIQHVKDSGVRTFPVDGLPVSTAPGGQLTPAITSDGAGGAIVAWTDDRGNDIYAQRITAAGSAAWTPDGILVCAAAGIQWFVDLVGDGSGGAIVTWQDSRSGVDDDIYAQRVSSGGTVLWSPSDGVNVSPVSGEQMFPQVVSDGVGGAIIAFTDGSVDPLGDIHAQRVNGSGALLWSGISGVTVCGVAGGQDVQRIVADGAGGAIVSWEDTRGGPNYDFYAQRINPGGAPSWTPSTGVAICTAPYTQDYDDVVSDGSGGAILVWEDARSGPGLSSVGFDIYARRVNGAGFALWDPDGDIVSAPGAAQLAPAIVADGFGGTLFAWEDYRTGCIGKIYAQGLDASGNLTWGVDGGAIANLGAGSQQGPKMCTDGWARGAYVVWTDFRNGNADIYAQHINSTPGLGWSGGFGLGVCVNPSPQITPNIVACESGGAIIVWDDQRGGADVVYAQKLLDTGAVAPGWPTDGLPVVTATNATKLIAPQVVSDGADGCIVTWQDGRAGNFDIYAQRIDAAGARRWVVSGLPVCAATGDQIKPQIVSDGAGGGIVTWEDNRAGNTDVYARRVDSTGSPLWAVDGVPVYADANTQSQPVIAIDGSGGAIVAWRDNRGGTQDVYAQRLNSSGAELWPSGGVAVCTGPGPQQDPAIISDGAHGAVIAWRDARSGEDDIYAQRLDGTGVAHCSACGIGVCTATAQQYQNILAPDGAGGAIVAWTDLRSTRADDIEVYASRFTPECGSYATGVDDSPTLAAADRLIQNRPNPFNPATLISYSLAAGGYVTVSVFDLAGRRVRTLVDAIQGQGPQHVMWNGDLDTGKRAASGPYFYMVTFPDGKTSSKKMLLLR